MRSANWYGKRNIRVEKRSDPPDPRPGWAVVKVALCGICGTDLHEYTDGPQYIPTKPNAATGEHPAQTLGHEITGTVAAVGQGITRAKVGDRVSVFAIQGCGECRMCRRSVPALCTNFGVTGLTTGDGGYGQYVTVKDGQLFPVPDSMSWSQASLVEPAACGVRSVRLSGLQPGDVVLVTGAGPIGQVTAMAARAAGASQIYISEVIAARRDMAMRAVQPTAVLDPTVVNVPQVLRDATEGWGADVAIECTANPRAFADALAATRKGGTMMQFGVFTQTVQLHPADITNYERRICGNLAYAPQDFDRTIELMATGQLPAERIVTAEIPLDDLVELGLDELTRSNTTHTKIQVRPD